MTSDPMPDDDLEHARRRQADPLVQVSQTETLLLREVDRLRSVAEEHRQTARHGYYDVQALQLERERLEGENARLRAENTAQAGQLAEIAELRRTWFQNADVVRGKADSIRGLTTVERAELRQGAVEMETCARQVGFALGPTAEEQPDFVARDLGRQRAAAALGLVQDRPNNERNTHER